MQWDQLLNRERRKASSRQLEEFRDEAERDYDRTVFSTPVRRLQDKAQVFPLEPHDSVRTRLTHSMEVSTVARDLAGKAAKELCKKDILTEDQASAVRTIAATCGLLHDIGNPPFGHAGEQAINSWFRRKYNHDVKQLEDSFGNTKSYRTSQLANDFWNFEGNAQTLRLIARLQVVANTYGLNLTYGTLSAACKYLASSDRTSDTHDLRKPGYFTSENDLISEIREKTGTGDSRNPITFLVEASDDIVYSVVDIEDGVKKGVVEWSQVRDELGKVDCEMMQECFKRVDQYFKDNPLTDLDKRGRNEAEAQMFQVFAIGLMVPEALKIFDERYDEIINGGYHEELLTDQHSRARCFVKACKTFSRKSIYTSKETLRLELMGRLVIHDLMNIFWEGVSENDGSGRVDKFPNKVFELLSRNYRVVYNEAKTKGNLPLIYCQMQLMTDYICGMTDTFACNLHKDLKNG